MNDNDTLRGMQTTTGTIHAGKMVTAPNGTTQIAPRCGKGNIRVFLRPTDRTDITCKRCIARVAR